MNLEQKLAEAIAAFAAAAGVTQHEIAVAIGTHQPRVSRLLAGNTRARLKMVEGVGIERLIGVTPGVIVRSVFDDSVDVGSEVAARDTTGTDLVREVIQARRAKGGAERTMAGVDARHTGHTRAAALAGAEALVAAETGRIADAEARLLEWLNGPDAEGDPFRGDDGER